MKHIRSGNNKTPVIFIGNGQPTMIKVFKESIGFDDAVIYTDPSLEIFDACGLNRGLTYLLSTSTLKSFYGLKKQGFSQGKQVKENGSHPQMGGVIVFSKLGEVLYYYSSKFLGDFPADSERENIN
jgi:hypothetical protein